MALVNLPISNVSIDYKFITALGGGDYLLGFKYNYRSGSWMLDILTTENEPVYMGIPIQLNIDILRQIRAYDIPKGVLVCINNLNEQEIPNRDNFSKEVVLLFEDGT